MVRKHTRISDFLIFLSTKPKIKVSDWLFQSKIHITHIVYQENYQNIPPYFKSISVWQIFSFLNYDAIKFIIFYKMKNYNINVYICCF